MIGHKTTVHGNGTKWLLLGGCSCFFLCFCREQKVISRRGTVCGEGGEEESDSLFTRTMKGVPSQPVVQETAAKWQITRVYPQPPFLRGAHSTSGIKRRWAASSKTPGISRPSIHHINLRRQCLQHPSVTSSRISLVQSSGSLCRLRPKVYEAFTVSDSSTSLRRQSFSDEKKLLAEFVPGWFSLEKFRMRRIDDIF